jgi:hypothetical protein
VDNTIAGDRFDTPMMDNDLSDVPTMAAILSMMVRYIVNDDGSQSPHVDVTLSRLNAAAAMDFLQGVENKQLGRCVKLLSMD